MQRAVGADIACRRAFGHDEFVVLPTGWQRRADDAVEHADEHGDDGKAHTDYHRSLVLLRHQLHAVRNATGECGDQTTP